MIIGLDVGGTHTDAVLIGEGSILRQAKVPTEHSDLFGCVLAGLEQVTTGIAPQKIRRAVLSTTLATNAIAEGKLAPAAMIVSAGPGINPLHFRTGPHYYCVSGSIDHRGREVRPINESEIEEIGSQLRSQGIRHLGVVSKFSVRNPEQEIKIAEILGNSFEIIIMGHLLSGNLNFPRRIATAFLNAAIYPIHRKFFEAVRASMDKKGLNVPIFVLKADGGTMGIDASIATPGQTVLSGPAASVIGSLPFASQTGDTLVLDIGGTTTDMAVLVRGVPLLEPLGARVGGFRTLIRALKSLSIPLGGDSTVRVIDGRIAIGPDRLGPAMAYGGPAPTPTDALFVMGEARDGSAESSARGLQPIADQLEIPLEEAADRIFELACREILAAAREMIERINAKPVYTIREILSGYKVEPREVLVLGGPAQYFAPRLSKISGLQVRAAPNFHVANAIGAALARTTSEVALFVDTERSIAAAPREDFKQQVGKIFSRDDAIELAFDLVRQKCLKSGAPDSEIEMEIIEDMQFNMIRNSRLVGKIIRIKVQVKPGLIPGYRELLGIPSENVPFPGDDPR
jgi:N-methylhydantoinase A